MSLRRLRLPPGFRLPIPIPHRNVCLSLFDSRVLDWVLSRVEWE